jgi:hypothetical protein
MPLELVSLGRLTLRMRPEVTLRGTPVGSRVIVQFTEIRWEGERLAGQQRGQVAADWLSVGPENTAILEIRFCIETPDGAVIYVHGHGRTDAATFNQGSPIFFSPFFETNAPQYAWLNRVAAVARGTVDGDRVTFEVGEVR